MTDPSPLMQTAIYMTAILAGYLLATPRAELAKAWTEIRRALHDRR